MTIEASEAAIVIEYGIPVTMLGPQQTIIVMKLTQQLLHHHP